ncbi:MAG: tRNA-specific adenosine deaminase [marine bacterium B5-7]|nr:MAG: tRNA-specific adenosine deaminase [marine bacterium B5-7]
MKTDHDWMQLALEQAKQAEQLGEVPVGAVLVHNNECIAMAHNEPIRLSDPSAHAELLCMRRAAESLKNYRLNDCTLYVTLEPCAMCAGAMIHARIARLVYATPDPRAGAVDSVLQLLQHPSLNHHVDVTSGVLAEEASQLLKQFFKAKR